MLPSYLTSPDHTLPSCTFLTKLHAAAGQVMLDGHVSIKYWGPPNIYLPFEALGFWYELLSIVKAKATWKSALRWVGSTPSHKNKSLAAHVNSIIQSAFWGGLIPKLGHTVYVSQMAELLLTLLLSSSHMDAMLLCFCARYEEEVGHQSGKKITLFPTILFTQCLAYLASEDTVSLDQLLENPVLSTIGNFVATSQQDFYITTVAYWPENHWGFVMITISGGCVQAKWGDGLHKKVPLMLERGIKLWSKRYLPQHIILVESRFPCASQTDSYFCGIVTMNALKHHILGNLLWTGATREQHHIEQFLTCMEFCVNKQLLPLNGDMQAAS
ncbi:hypothetical protein BDN71DRAFT_1429514 [Pleurotus eryngii]|uniref:Ubiquitin-like protease family profile domain-containing protein n=1 Tax=Pleurotus eryngii TaxID=5323 RepID=A0A9P6DH69_PLEER|nr:hypothetical protein BDN71DRAFT_1429514 [Pleurotus eryngii]